VTALPDGLRRQLQKLWRRALTELVMKLRTPDRVFRLGDDVPPVGEHQFPGDLRTLTEPDLLKFVEAHDHTGGTGLGSGADDWASLDERMNYLVTLFRGWQQHGRLLESPFTADQIADMQAGRRPRGDL
jgi:hypothetical protein